MLGLPFAATVFAVALLASGQNVTLTATLAGQIVMEGFLELRLAPWARRLVTRGVAIVPALVVLAIWRSAAIGKLLLITQVVLSLQLPFAVVPWVQFTGNCCLMGRFANRRWLQVVAVAIAIALIVLNGKLVFDVGERTRPANWKDPIAPERQCHSPCSQQELPLLLQTWLRSVYAQRSRRAVDTPL